MERRCKNGLSSVALAGIFRGVGRLREKQTGNEVILPAVCLVGRGAHCIVRLENADVSIEHASLRWVKDHWELRDLGSKNGTFKHGVRLSAGLAVPVARNESLRFGPHEWALVDVDAPTAVAVNLETGQNRIASGGYLCLPDETEPLAAVFRDASGQWVVEDETHQRPARHGDLILCDGQPWRVFVPDGAFGTEESEGNQPVATTLHFGVSQNEEQVEVAVAVGNTNVALPPRAFHYVLLTLARIKQRALEDGIDPERSGWVHVSELARLLRSDATYVNLCVHRLRRQLAELGIPPAIPVIQRRQTQGELRLGPVSIEIRRL